MARRSSHTNGLTCRSTGPESLGQLLVLTLAQHRGGNVMAADKAHEFLRIHFVTVITGILMRHRLAVNGLAVNVALLCARWLRRRLARVRSGHGLLPID